MPRDAAHGESPDTGAAPVLGVDLGGTNMRVAVVGPRGEVRERLVEPTPQDDPGALARLMLRVTERMPERPRGAVVGVPAVVDYVEGRALRMPNIPDWEGHLDAQSLADATRLPTLFANDADLAAVGEHRYGAGRDAHDMVYVTVSTGVGAGVILGDRLVHGRRSIAEVGHTIIDYRNADPGEPDRIGALEGLGSGSALERISGLDGVEVTRRALAGDAQALGWLGEVVAAFAAGVVNLAEAYAPERIVIGGGVSQAGELLLRPVREYFARSHAARQLDPSEIVLAESGDDAGLRGAYALWEDSEAPPPPDGRLRPFLPR